MNVRHIHTQAQKNCVVFHLNPHSSTFTVTQIAEIHATLLTHAALYVHAASHTYDRRRQSLIPFMAAPELGFKYIFHATLPPMAANEEKKGGRLGETKRGSKLQTLLSLPAACLPLPLLSFLFPSYLYPPVSSSFIFFNGWEPEWVTDVFLLGPHMTRVVICFNEPGTQGKR